MEWFIDGESEDRATGKPGPKGPQPGGKSFHSMHREEKKSFPLAKAVLWMV